MNDQDKKEFFRLYDQQQKSYLFYQKTKRGDLLALHASPDLRFVEECQTIWYRDHREMMDFMEERDMTHHDMSDLLRSRVKESGRVKRLTG